jgi:hypothetical protein
MPVLGPSDQVEYDAPASTGRQRLAPTDKVEFDSIPSPAAPTMPDKGAVNAFGQGALQGGTFGFWDEITSGLKALADSHDIRDVPSAYHRNVDQARSELHAAEQQHPIASTLGSVAGGVATMAIPGAGMARLGTGLAANAARGAGAGILSGLGESEAPTMGGVVSDAAKGGLVGAAVGGTLGTLAEKGLRGAQGRVDERLVSDITGGRATAAGKKVHGNDDLVVAAAKKFGLDASARDAGQLAAATDAARNQVGEKLSAAYNAIDHEALGARVGDVRRAVGQVKADLSSPSDEPLRRQLDTYLEAVKARWGEGARARVPLQALNAEIGKLEQVGFAGADLSPQAGKVLKRNLAGALEDVLQNRLEEVKSLGGRVAKSSLAQREGWQGMEAAAQAAQDLPGLNKDYRGLKLIQRIADERAQLPPASRAAGGLRNAVNGAVDMGLLFTHPAAFAAKKGVDVVAPRLAAGADAALARLVTASQTGQMSAQLVQQAIEAGVPRGLISKLAGGVVTEQQSPYGSE